VSDVTAMTGLEATEDLVRRLAAAVRAASLYSCAHPLVERNADRLATACNRLLEKTGTLVVGLIGDELVVNDARLPKAAAVLTGFLRELREREIEKVTLFYGVTREEIAAFIEALADRASGPLPERLVQRGVRRITAGRIAVEDAAPQTGIAAARQVYRTATQTAESLWDAARAGEKPDPACARKLVNSLARAIADDRTAVMTLTALKKYDDYTFTHMVNVAVLTMAQARALNISGPLLHEFGIAGLMHDVGKVRTPPGLLNKSGALTRDEFAIVKRHVIDGAHLLRRTPEMPILASVVAFEHHLKQDLSGYPESLGPRKLNLCTMLVTIADVYDALRTNRPYRGGLASERVRSIMAERESGAFDRRLLKRFVTLVGLFPAGNLVRLNTGEIAVVTREHPGDPFRPQVKILVDARGDRLETPEVVNTWERDERGEYPWAVVEAVDPDEWGLDPIEHL